MPGYPSGRSASPAIRGRVLSFIAVLLIIVQIIFSVITYFLFPGIVPSHWNAAGQVDSSIPKLGFILIFLGISLGMYILLQLIKALTMLDNDPQKRQAAALILGLISIFVVLVGLVTQVITTSVILHW